VRIPAVLSAEIAKIITDSEFQEQIKKNDRLLQFAWGLLAYYGAVSIMQLIEFYDFYFEVETEAEKIHHFFQEMNEFHKNTRLWVLKGHTPNEMMEEELKHLRPLPEKEYKSSSHGELTVIKGEKVGRNDPCPCGSGKKYKKCCLGKD